MLAETTSPISEFLRATGAKIADRVLARQEEYTTGLYVEEGKLLKDKLHAIIIEEVMNYG